MEINTIHINIYSIIIYLLLFLLVLIDITLFIQCENIGSENNQRYWKLFYIYSCWNFKQMCIAILQ